MENLKPILANIDTAFGENPLRKIVEKLPKIFPDLIKDVISQRYFRALPFVPPERLTKKQRRATINALERTLLFLDKLGELKDWEKVVMKTPGNESGLLLANAIKERQRISGEAGNFLREQIQELKRPAPPKRGSKPKNPSLHSLALVLYQEIFMFGKKIRVSEADEIVSTVLGIVSSTESQDVNEFAKKIRLRKFQSLSAFRKKRWDGTD